MKGIPYTLQNYCFCVTECKLLFLFLLGMDSSIPRDTSFTNLLEDSYDEYMSGSSHISGEDSVAQAQAFSQMSPPKLNPQLRNYNVAATSPYNKTCFLCLHFSMSTRMQCKALTKNAQHIGQEFGSITTSGRPLLLSVQ